MNLKRLFDIIVSSFVLLISLPLLLLAAIGIRVSSRGPIIYKARRAGLGGQIFIMHKLRTMDAGNRATENAISSAKDPRVFAFGSFLRRTKIDELPQFYDVLIGKMSLVGPRPEDPRIVRDYYSFEGMKTLNVPPGLTSVGSLYYYIYGEQLLTDDDPERFYVQQLLPIKLALDAQYIDHASFTSDLGVLIKTAQAIILKSINRQPSDLRFVRADLAKGALR